VGSLASLVALALPVLASWVELFRQLQDKSEVDLALQPLNGFQVSHHCYPSCFQVSSRVITMSQIWHRMHNVNNFHNVKALNLPKIFSMQLLLNALNKQVRHGLNGFIIR
jgi:hypothetical protein